MVCKACTLQTGSSAAAQLLYFEYVSFMTLWTSARARFHVIFVSDTLSLYHKTNIRHVTYSPCAFSARAKFSRSAAFRTFCLPVPQLDLYPEQLSCHAYLQPTAAQIQLCHGDGAHK